MNPALGSGIPRVGIGVDVHAFAPVDAPRELWVGGLLWPGARGLDDIIEGMRESVTQTPGRATISFLKS